MPTTYTHDLFGKEVYKRMPGEAKKIIKKHGELYRIGLQGPDILFYYMVSKNPVSQFGVDMHNEKARAFFEQGMDQVRENKDEELLAYLLGFACHYLLDSACHPFVNRMDEEGVISHTNLEKEFDRYLMIETGKNPFHYYPSDSIVPKRKYAKVIHRAIPLVRTANIHISLKMMKFLTNLMVCDDHEKRRNFLCSIAKGKKLSGLMEHFMTEKPLEEAAEPMAELERLYREAIEDVPACLEELLTLAEGEYRLSARWNRTYNG